MNWRNFSLLAMMSEGMPILWMLALSTNLLILAANLTTLVSVMEHSFFMVDLSRCGWLCWRICLSCVCCCCRCSSEETEGVEWCEWWEEVEEVDDDESLSEEKCISFRNCWSFVLSLGDEDGLGCLFFFGFVEEVWWVDFLGRSGINCGVELLEKLILGVWSVGCCDGLSC